MARTLYAADPASVPVIGCSPPSWMARIALEEKGAAHAVRTLDFAAGEHRSEAMRAISPKGTIPVLEDGDAVLTDTFAILLWIELASPAPSLLGDDPAGRARGLDAFQASAPVKQHGMGLLAWWLRAGGGEGADAGVKAEKVAAFEGALAPWAEALGASSWAAGIHGPTLADLVLFAYFVPAMRLGLVDADGLPSLTDHAARMQARPSVKRTWPFPD